jgi:hypothetical protein
MNNNIFKTKYNINKDENKLKIINKNKNLCIENKQEFPELVSREIKNQTNEDTINYKTATLKEAPKIVEDKFTLQPGWTKITYKNNTIEKEYLPPIQKKRNNINEKEIDEKQMMNKQMNYAIEVINQRRLYYIEQYGEDSYKKIYGTYEIMNDEYNDEDDDDENYNEEEYDIYD